MRCWLCCSCAQNRFGTQPVVVTNTTFTSNAGQVGRVRVCTQRTSTVTGSFSVRLSMCTYTSLAFGSHVCTFLVCLCRPQRTPTSVSLCQVSTMQECSYTMPLPAPLTRAQYVP